MEGGFPYGDIIVIAAIAAFIILRYRAMLGESRGRDDMGSSMGQKLQELERVIQLPTARVVEKKPEDNFSEKYGSLAESYVAMRAIDREFRRRIFLSVRARRMRW